MHEERVDFAFGMHIELTSKSLRHSGEMFSVKLCLLSVYHLYEIQWYALRFQRRNKTKSDVSLKVQGILLPH